MNHTAHGLVVFVGIGAAIGLIIGLSKWSEFKTVDERLGYAVMCALGGVLIAGLLGGGAVMCNLNGNEF